MEKVETLYTSINSINKLDNYIRNVIYEDLEYTNELLNPGVSKSIKASLVKGMILAMKEDIILKPKNSTYTNNLLFSAIDSLASKIAVINEDGTINLGGIEFSDGNELVAKIRNKFAHGDYVYSEDCEYILFNFDGNEIPVSLNALTDFAVELFYKRIEYKKTDSFHKPIWIFCGIKKTVKYVKSRISYEEMKEMLDLFFEYDFELKSSNGMIPKDAYLLLDTFKDKINNIRYKYRDDDFKVILKKVDKEVEECINYFNNTSEKNKWNVTINYTKGKLSDEQKYRTIDNLMKIKGGKVTTINVIDELPRYASRSFCFENNKDVYIPQMALLLGVIDIIEQSNITNISHVGLELSARMNAPLNIDQDMYGTIQILRLLEFAYMFENFDVDYGDLPLDDIKPNKCDKRDVELEEKCNKVNQARNRILEQEEYIKNISSQLNNVMNLNIDDNKKSEILLKLGKKLLSMQKDKELFQTSLNTYVKEANDLYEDRRINNKYYTNKYLVERLRDSISHGNVYIIPSGTISETIIRFEDIYDDKLVFQLDIRLDVLKIILDECTNKLASKEVKIRNK